jgi:hypothetical protein
MQLFAFLFLSNSIFIIIFISSIYLPEPFSNIDECLAYMCNNNSEHHYVVKTSFS